ncbi:hypothetical protein J2W33_004417 [Variovorax boronicumulans]|nr:hypothetical protein [Variovorax boronicumulans]
MSANQIIKKHDKCAEARAEHMPVPLKVTPAREAIAT